MKKTFLVLLFSSFYLFVSSQDTLRYYLDNNLKKAEKEKAVILRTEILNNNHYYVIDKFLNGKMRKYSECSSVEPWIEDGLTRHYRFGLLYSTGQYKSGKLSGKWNYSTNNFEDIIDYSGVENYIKFLKDSCLKNKQIIYDSIITVDNAVIIQNLIQFIKKNLHLPARILGIKDNNKINVSFILDTDGFIKCPEVINCYNDDFAYEALRILFLYKNDINIQNPIKFNIPILFETELPYIIVDEPARFKGGNINDFRLFVQKKLNYPPNALKNKIKGKVIVQFEVGTKGDVFNAKVLHGVDSDLDQEAIRCINNSPKWTPAKNGGKEVRQQFVIPIIFDL
jgi:TonB family protein